MNTYMFDLGNSTQGAVGMTARVDAETPLAALRILRDTLPDHIAIEDLQDDLSNARTEGVLFLNAEAIHLSDITGISQDPKDSEPNLNADALPYLVEAIQDAIAYLNVQAQRAPLGLDDERDDLRQTLCKAYSFATNQVNVGNLQRVNEIKEFLYNVQGT